MSKVSLIEMGIPNNGGKKESDLSSLSLNVQFLFFVDFLVSSHFSAILRAF
jgi:hypothetical protein